MSSATLKKIMEHWSVPIDADSGFIDLPFNIEAFCAEMDSYVANLVFERDEALELRDHYSAVIAQLRHKLDH